MSHSSDCWMNSSIYLTKYSTPRRKISKLGTEVLWNFGRVRVHLQPWAKNLQPGATHDNFSSYIAGRQIMRRLW